MSFLSISSGLVKVWLFSVFPVLFPTIILSKLIMYLHFDKYIKRIFFIPFRMLWGIKKDSVTALLFGLIFGFPVGASFCSHEASKDISEAQYALALCNNFSPAFIISYVTVATLDIKDKKFLILLAILTASVLYGLIHRITSRHNTPDASRHKNPHSVSLIPSEASPCDFQSDSPAFPESTCSSTDKPYSKIPLDDFIVESFSTLVKICGYMLLCGIPAGILSYLSPVFSFAAGLLEVSSGVVYLGTCSIPFEIKTVLATFLTAFGGISGVFQTKTVITGSGLSLSRYILDKLCIALLSSIIVYALLKLRL